MPPPYPVYIVVQVEARHLRYAIALAEHRHFGRAAASLGIAQPPLSKQIRDLEREVGAELFIRSARGVTPTDAGEAFLARARRALAEMTAAPLDARRAARGETGRLRIGFIGSALLEPLPGLLSVFRDTHPEIRLELHERSSRQTAVDLAAGELDVGITRGAPRGAGAETLTSVPVGRDRLVAVLSRQHPFAGSASIAIEQLSGQSIILAETREEPATMDGLFAAVEGALGYRWRPDQTIEVRDVHTIIGLAACGLGVGLGPASIRSAPRPGTWVCDVEPAVHLPDLVLSFRTGDASAALAAFLDVTASQSPVARKTSNR